MIILSGFGQFEYAQKAIQANVIDYILKPVDTKQLGETLNKTRAFLDEEIERHRNMENLRQIYQKNLPVLREHFLVDLVNGRYNRNQIERSMKEYNLDLMTADSWTVASIDITYTEERDEWDRRLMPLFVRELLEDQFDDHFKYAAACSPQEMFVVVALSREAAFSHMLRRFAIVGKECKRILNLDIMIGVGGVCHDLTGIDRSYREAQTALGYQQLRDWDYVIYIGDVEPDDSQSLSYDEQDEADVTAVLKFETDEAEIARLVDRLLKKMDDAKAHKSQYQRYIIGILNTLTQMVHKYDLDEAVIFGTDDFFHTLQDMDDNATLRQWLIQICTTLNQQIKVRRESDERHIIRLALEYIEENFQNPDLSAKMICQKFHITAAYFSSLFKQVTGKNYVNHLTDLRMKKAVELLDNTEDKSYRIAEQTGYTEASYFSYVFKKYYGVSPSKYRNNKKSE